MVLKKVMILYLKIGCHYKMKFSIIIHTLEEYNYGKIKIKFKTWKLICY
jgi:hypothetical protein